MMINGVTVVSAPAEIDIVNAEELRTVVREAGRLGHATVVVDMTGTRFCDSEGFSALAGVHKWALAEGGGLRLVIPAGSRVLRIFRVIGLGASSPGSPAWNRPLTQGLPPRAHKYLRARPPSHVSPPNLLTERERVRGRKSGEEMAVAFTEATPPTAEQAQVFIDQAVRWVVSECASSPGPAADLRPPTST